MDTYLRDRARAKYAERRRVETAETLLDVSEVSEFQYALDNEIMETDNSDGNEDYCAVCKDVREEDLLCCERCPKVFHLKCHIPALKEIPDEGVWQCFFCKPREEVFNEPETEGDKSCHYSSIQFRSRREFLSACKFVCEVYMIPESVVTRSIDFEKMMLEKLGGGGRIRNLPNIQKRLTIMEPKPYSSFSEVVDDVMKMILEAKDLYINTKENSILNEYIHAKHLEAKVTALYKTYYLPHI